MRSRFLIASALCVVLVMWGCASDEPVAPKDKNPPVTEGDVTLTPSQDNTIYDVPDNYSNGAGVYMVVGQTNQGGVRRGLVQFDVAAGVPAGSTIDSVIVEMHMSLTQATGYQIKLHKLLASWGEAGSDAGTGPGNGGAGDGPGIGAPAAVGDATWLRRMFDTVSWTTAGGDFNATASAATTVGSVGFYRWNSPQLKADVQDWLDNPGNNHGWILVGEEGLKSGKRFDTRESTTAANRPKLILWITGP